SRFARALSDLLRERTRKHFVAAPTAAIRRQLLESDELRHERANDRAMARDASLDRSLAAIDPPHHFDFGLAKNVLRVLLEVLFALDEVRRVARVPKWCLHHEIRAEIVLLGERKQ